MINKNIARQTKCIPNPDAFFFDENSHKHWKTLGPQQF